MIKLIHKQCGGLVARLDRRLTMGSPISSDNIHYAGEQKGRKVPNICPQCLQSFGWNNQDLRQESTE